MRIIVDTNVLVGAVMQDEPCQAAKAAALLKDAETIAAPLPCLCEFVRVLRRVYDLKPDDIAAAIGALVDTENVVVNRPAVELGLAVLRGGGDFAGGVIAYEGRWLGGETFASFDEKAVALVSGQGHDSRLLV